MYTCSWQPVLVATFRREIAEHQLNRFLHVHVALSAVVGLLPLFTPDDVTRSTSAWAMPAVLYCLSLSALLLGLSSAHGDADEFSLLFSQPVHRGVWLVGKALALAALLLPASLLLVLPAALLGGLDATLMLLVPAAGGVSLALAMLGLAIGFWVRDPVRGLLGAMGLWFGLLFGTDLALLAVAGAPWVQAHPSAWVLPLMLNPLDALRVTVLFALEDTAPAGLDGGSLAGWWVAHGGLWLAALLTAWVLGGLGLGLAGARRQVDL